MILLSVLIFIIAILGTPIFSVMGFSAIISHNNAEIDLQALIINFYQLANKPLLQTLPLFAFAGYLLTYSGAPNRLLNFSKALLGWVPGGLAIERSLHAPFLLLLPEHRVLRSLPLADFSSPH